jgi:PAS domain S-box-containing protein
MACPHQTITGPEVCLAGGGEMGERIRTFDWSNTAVGPAAGWPQSLKTAVSICIGSRYPIVIWWGNPAYTMFYNDAYISFLGRTKHPGWLGRSGRECWSEIWPTIGPMLEGVFATGEATWSEDLLLVLHRNLPREEGYFTFSYSPIRDDAGQVGGIFCACYETTGRVIGERRLQTLRNLGRTVMEVKSAGEACEVAVQTLAAHSADIPFTLIYLLDSEAQHARLIATTGLEVGSASAPERIAMHESAESATWPLRRVFDTAATELVADLAARCEPLPGGPWPESPEAALILPIATPGQTRPTGFLVAGLSPRRVVDADYRSFCDLIAGHVGTAIANARAYEEERKRAEALAELDRAKTAFFSNVSHEFRTPLTLMLGPLEQALSAPDGALAPPQRAELEVVHRNGLRLLKLVNTLLDFARIEAGRIEASYAPTDLAACTADLASVFRSAIERAGLRLVVDCPPLPEAVYVDRDMWEKIVLNLLSNACKFTFAGQIAVRLAWGGAHVALAVRDTGTGIPAHELPHIFARFHRIRDARARTHEGTGIGLALVQELVRLHGGQITVESAVGIGTTFMVTLPTGTAHLPADRLSMTRMLASTALGADAYVQEALHWLPGAPERPSDVEVPFPHTPVSPLPSTPTHGRILLADDNADMRAYVQRLLSPHWEVEAVADGTQALAVANERLPDLVLADVMMPGLDGFALLRALRADLRTATIPVILLSARAGEESRVEGMEAGADDYLIKPFSARELLARVESHIKMARFRHEAAAAIRESERRLSTLIASLPGMAYRCRNDRQWTMEFVSDRVTDITGYTPEDFTSGRIHWAHLWHPDDVEWTWEAVQSASREQRPFQFEYRIRHKDGSERWIWEQGRAVLDGASQPTVCEGFVTDVTERRQAEEALRQSHAELRLHMDEMARFNRVAVGREMRLVELKQEVNALRERHGESARYPLDLEPAKAEPPSVSRLPGEEGDGLVPLEAILCTEALHQRPRRAPAYKVENRALAALVQALPTRRAVFCRRWPRRPWRSCELVPQD